MPPILPWIAPDGGHDPLPGVCFGVMKITAIPAPEAALRLAQASALAALGLLVHERARVRR